MQYVHFKSNHTKRFGHHLYILSLHFMWYLFGLIPGQRYAMCLADRIKSATPSIKGPKEVYLKRERGFFREFVSLGQLYIRKMFSCFTTPSGTHTHTPRRPQCLRFSQAQDGFGWIQTEDLIWGAKWTHGRLGVQQLVNQCSAAVSIQAAAVWWLDGAAMQDCHWAVQVRWDDNEIFRLQHYLCLQTASEHVCQHGDGAGVSCQQFQGQSCQTVTEDEDCDDEMTVCETAEKEQCYTKYEEEC